MKMHLLGLALTLCFAACFAAAEDQISVHALRLYNPNMPANPPATCYNGAPCMLNYNGGPVFETAPTVYIVWYGSWKSKDKSIIDYYFAHLGGSTQEKINHTYSDSSGKFIQNKVIHSSKDDYHDNYSLGKSLGDSQIQEVVANAIKNGHLPSDVNGIYFVLAYKDVSSGNCNQYCGYHGASNSIVSGETIVYSFVGDPDQCPSSCSAPAVEHDSGKGGSPNQDPGADGAISIMWHEFSESSTDEHLNAWWQSAGQGWENGDLCAWNFGTTKKDSNGNIYTNTVGTKNFITQTMFELTSKSRSGNVPGECENVYTKP
jgi:hypothetical protein